jgi:hypothetical protein
LSTLFAFTTKPRYGVNFLRDHLWSIKAHFSTDLCCLYLRLDQILPFRHRTPYAYMGQTQPIWVIALPLRQRRPVSHVNDRLYRLYCSHGSGYGPLDVPFRQSD